MKAQILTFAAACLLFSCTQKPVQNPKIAVKYPDTQKVDQKDVYFGTEVADPYRWLEDDHSAETAEWVKAQNAVTFGYLDQIPYRADMEKALSTMWNFPKEGTPWKKAGKYFFSRNNGIQNQFVLYVKDALDAPERVLIDPNTLSKDGTVSLGGLGVSKDGQTVAYALSTGGSDWNEIHTKTMDGKDLPDVIKWVKFSGIAWYKDGFFYSAYDAPTGSALSQKNEYQKVYYHKMGTGQSQDILVYEDKTSAQKMFYAGTTEDEQFLILSASKGGEKGNTLMVRKLDGNIVGPFKTLVDKFGYDCSVVENLGDDLFIHTNENAPNNKLLKINFNSPQLTFTEVIPEKEDVLQGTSFIGNKIIASYLHNAASKISVFAQDGKYEQDIQLPEIATISGISGDKESNEMFYSYMSFTNPGCIYKMDVSTLKSEVYKETKMAFQPSKYICEQVFYPSKDGTPIPMFIVYKDGMKKNGKNPVLLYGYGGFNVSLTPGFSISRMLFLENGGVYVMANLRGGGEFGEKWHEAGTKLHKQNVFDDFIAAAEYLIKEKYTEPQKLAIQGGSNGGLLVGACMTQRPELFAVALPQVGVMDMLRYHKFTIGWAWETDYGSSDKKEEFDYLLKYSPLHNVKEGVCYPATLVTTADHDDRVVPAHSFKFISELQAKQKCDNPVLIRIETMAGHGAGKSTEKTIKEVTDSWAFTFYNLNMEYKNPVK